MCCGDPGSRTNELMYITDSLNSTIDVYSVPAPFGIPTSGRCLGFDPGTYSVAIATDCSVMFSYDGRSLRESTTSKTLCMSDLQSGAEAILTSVCAYAMTFDYAARGGSRVCVTSSVDLCLDIMGYSPRNGLKFDYSSNVLFTYIYNGMSQNFCSKRAH